MEITQFGSSIEVKLRYSKSRGWEGFIKKTWISLTEINGMDREELAVLIVHKQFMTKLISDDTTNQFYIENGVTFHLQVFQQQP